MPCKLAYSLLFWRSFFNWGSLLSSDSSLCKVDIKTSQPSYLGQQSVNELGNTPGEHCANSTATCIGLSGPGQSHLWEVPVISFGVCFWGEGMVRRASCVNVSKNSVPFLLSLDTEVLCSWFSGSLNSWAYAIIWSPLGPSCWATPWDPSFQTEGCGTSQLPNCVRQLLQKTPFCNRKYLMVLQFPGEP